MQRSCFARLRAACCTGTIAEPCLPRRVPWPVRLVPKEHTCKLKPASTHGARAHRIRAHLQAQARKRTHRSNAQACIHPHARRRFRANGRRCNRSCRSRRNTRLQHRATRCAGAPTRAASVATRAHIAPLEADHRGREVDAELTHGLHESQALHGRERRGGELAGAGSRAWWSGVGAGRTRSIAGTARWTVPEGRNAAHLHRPHRPIDRPPGVGAARRATPTLSLLTRQPFCRPLEGRGLGLSTIYMTRSQCRVLKGCCHVRTAVWDAVPCRILCRAVCHLGVAHHNSIRP